MKYVACGKLDVLDEIMPRISLCSLVVADSTHLCRNSQISGCCRGSLNSVRIAGSVSRILG